MVIKEIHCKSILNKSRIPVIDYAINPYIGCGHKCQYCYAVFMKKFTEHNKPWGDFVDVKINAPDVLSRQIRKIKKSRISFSTVCDPYQQVEAKYKITRQCLEKLLNYQHSVSILTKSSLVVRDLDILKKLRQIEVGFSIITLNPRVKRIFEPNSSSPQKRFEALKILSKNGISTWVFVAPILPYLSDSKETINRLFKASQNAGAHYIMFDTLNPYPRVWNNVKHLARGYFPETVDSLDFYYYNRIKYTKRLKEKISKIGRQYKIRYKCTF